MFASYGSNGALQVSIGGADAGTTATGVNPDSQTVFENVFTITNKGAQPVSVWFAGGSEAVMFIRLDGRPIEGKARAVTLQPGGEPLHVGLVIDARGVTPGANLLQSVEIHTDASGAGESVLGKRSDASASDISGSDGSGLDVPIGGGPVPRPVGDGTRFYSLRNPGGLDGADTPSEFTTTTAKSLFPFGSFGSVLTERDDCSKSSPETAQSTPSAPRHAPTPSTETPQSRKTEDTVPRHAPTSPCGEGGNIEISIDKDSPMVMAAAGVIVVVPEGVLGPADEAAAVGWTAKQAAPYIAGGLVTLGSILATDNTEETKQREQNENTENSQENRKNQKSQGKQKNERDGDSGGRRYPKPPRLIPNGGSENRPHGYDANKESPKIPLRTGTTKATTSGR